jgi:hypothetical protein
MVATPRTVHRDGIRFEGLRYHSPVLAPYVGTSVTIRYDPRDLGEIRVFTRDRLRVPGDQPRTRHRDDHPQRHPSRPRRAAPSAGNFHAGFFEEMSPRDFRAQVETNLFGPLNVTRAVLPVMRSQRSGLVVAISSTAGITGLEFVSAYSASKFGIEGWIESLTPEVAPFGIRTMLVEPGFFRTELLTPESTSFAEPTIDDYAERTKQTVTAWNGMNGLQGGDPAKLAKALVQLAGQDKPPLRWAAGADAVETVEQKAKNMLDQVDTHRELSSSLAHNDTRA